MTPRTRTPDGTGFLWSEPGEQREGVVAEVAPLVHVFHTYSFAVPDSMVAMLKPGRRVQISLGRRGRSARAIVVSLDRRIWDSTLRPITQVLDADSFLTPELIELAREISTHYFCPLGRTLAAMTPEAARTGAGLHTVRSVRLVTDLDTAAKATNRLTRKRRAVLERLTGATTPLSMDTLLKDSGATMAVVRSLVKAGILEILERREEVREAKEPDPTNVEPSFSLTAEQRAALEHVNARLDAHRFSVTLLYGVSGSGKTEVYIRAMQRVIAAGGAAMLLVPEIMLTTQLVNRLASRFPDLAVHHSGMTNVQRSRSWRLIASGERRIIIGTRSAVFAPAPRLDLICVDEEQEGSYKNQQAPRYHVRDVAIMRAKRLQIPIVLGSATPSLEIWYHCEHRPDYHRVTLPRRIHDRPLPRIGVIDMVEERLKSKQPLVLSPRFEELLGESLARGEQALLLVNRRGFATCAYCPECKSALGCPHCQVNLVVHRSVGEAVCHYCRTRIKTPTHCPTVGCGRPLLWTGVGTQRVEDLLARRFPKARMERVDSDTMTHREHYARIVQNFEQRLIDVLVGTQMIAKGLDFPFVSFVGIVHADSVGPLSDFRGPERLFQLLTQMAGRAGRGDVPGLVIVQTMTPAAPALQFARSHDYEGFVAAELKMRQRAGLPPFRRLARVVLSHQRDETVRQECDALGGRIRQAIAGLNLPNADVLGPNPCVLPRLRSRYRYDLLIRTADVVSLRKLMSALIESDAVRTKAESTVVDVDPVALT